MSRGEQDIDDPGHHDLMEAADFIFVGIPAPPGMARSYELSCAEARGDSHYSPAAHAQPRQLWIFRLGDPDVTQDDIEALVALGVSSVRVETGTEALGSALRHYSVLISEHRASEAASARELVTLRRELNRALSGLSAQHPILGLIPSSTLEDLTYERAGWREDPSSEVPALFEFLNETHDGVADLYGSGLRGSASAQAEILRLHEAITVMESTKVMRWSRAPRRLYARLWSR